MRSFHEWTTHWSLGVHCSNRHNGFFLSACARVCVCVCVNKQPLGLSAVHICRWTPGGKTKEEPAWRPLQINTPSSLSVLLKPAGSSLTLCKSSATFNVHYANPSAPATAGSVYTNGDAISRVYATALRDENIWWQISHMHYKKPPSISRSVKGMEAGVVNVRGSCVSERTANET